MMVGNENEIKKKYMYNSDSDECEMSKIALKIQSHVFKMRKITAQHNYCTHVQRMLLNTKQNFQHNGIFMFNFDGKTRKNEFYFIQAKSSKSISMKTSPHFFFN